MQCPIEHILVHIVQKPQHPAACSQLTLNIPEGICPFFQLDLLDLGSKHWNDCKGDEQ